MPVLEIEIVTVDLEELDPGLAGRLADAAGAVFGSPPGRTWVRLRTLPVQQYAENGGPLPGDIRPVFVTVLHAQRPDGEALHHEINLLSTAIAAACDRPADNVHIFYQPDGRGRVAFGGRLIE